MRHIAIVSEDIQTLYNVALGVVCGGKIYADSYGTAVYFQGSGRSWPDIFGSEWTHRSWGDVDFA